MLGQVMGRWAVSQKCEMIPLISMCFTEIRQSKRTKLRGNGRKSWPPVKALSKFSLVKAVFKVFRAFIHSFVAGQNYTVSNNLPFMTTLSSYKNKVLEFLQIYSFFWISLEQSFQRKIIAVTCRSLVLSSVCQPPCRSNI